jgi:hypothetical protein
VAGGWFVCFGDKMNAAANSQQFSVSNAMNGESLTRISSETSIILLSIDSVL